LIPTSYGFVYPVICQGIKMDKKACWRRGLASGSLSSLIHWKPVEGAWQSLWSLHMLFHAQSLLGSAGLFQTWKLTITVGGSFILEK
jgi:hypothetical protein